MFKIAAIVWIMLSVVLAGIVLLVIVTVPSLAAKAQLLIPVACISALVLAMPLSYLVARSISASRAG
jgi:hypothetical protein